MDLLCRRAPRSSPATLPPRRLVRGARRRPAGAAAASGGRAVGVRGGARRDRRAAARPRAAPYVAEQTAESLLRRRPRIGGARGFGLDAGRRSARARATRSRPTRCGSRSHLLSLVPTLRTAPAAGAGPPARAGARAADDSGRPRDADVAGAAARRSAGCCPARRRRPRCWSPPWCTPTSRPPRRSPPTTGSWPGRPSGWCGSTRGVDETSVLVPEAGHLALRAAYESNLRGLPRRRPGRRAAWLRYAAEARGQGCRGEPAGATG